ncbi:MAG: ATP-binding cassette domain-containing protein [Acidobacteria bacterium]|nr:ATP-binding cassette domain-containing protein [Acidobacteriota bacterium]
MLEVLNITKSWGPVRANRDITLTAAPGTVLGVLGENGAGKSTLGKVLSGFVRPDAGEVRLDGRRVTPGSPAAALSAGVGMLHQDPLDFPPQTVLENYLAGPGTGFFLRQKTARAELRRSAADLGFDLDPGVPVGDLTVGERQQLEILRLLRTGVRVLILDEPTTGISAAQGEALARAVRSLSARGVTVLLVSHKLKEVQDLCDRIAVLRDGALQGVLDPPFDTATLVRLMFGRDAFPAESTPPRSGPPLLRLRGLTLDGGRLRAGPVDLDLAEGSITGLAGMDGSGQGLFLRACAGLLPASAGTVEVHDGSGFRPSPPRSLRARAVFCPAARLDEGIFPGMTVAEHLALATPRAAFFRRPTAGDDDARAAIERFGIRGQPGTDAVALSGGNQQKLLLAMLPEKARLLCLEHPTRGLDLEAAAQVRRHLSDRAAKGAAILFSSADLDEVLGFSHQVLVFFAGAVRGPFPAASLSVGQLGRMMGGAGE